MIDAIVSLSVPKFAVLVLALVIVIMNIIWPVWSVTRAFITNDKVRRTSLTIGLTKITLEKTTRKVGG